MLLGFLILLLISETSEKRFGHKYSLSINPLAVFIGVAGHAGGIILPNPGINFEVKGGGNWSFNFEINAIFFIPTEIEVGIREYLKKEKEFRGFYLYQGLAFGWTNFVFGIYIPNLILAVGYKNVSAKGFTIDPILGLRAVYTDFVVLPVLGLYLGRTW
jgi:hypothetical protein